VEFIPALVTTKQASSTPIVAGLIPAARTGLRGLQIWLYQRILAPHSDFVCAICIHPAAELDRVRVRKLNTVNTFTHDTERSAFWLDVLLECFYQTSTKRCTATCINASQWAIRVSMVKVKSAVAVIQTAYKMRQQQRRYIRPLHGQRLLRCKSPLLKSLYQAIAVIAYPIPITTFVGCYWIGGVQNSIDLFQQVAVLRPNSKARCCAV
jgi:hypothetical protein